MRRVLRTGWLLLLGTSALRASAQNKCSPYIFVSDQEIPADPVYTAGESAIFWVSPLAAPGKRTVVTGAFGPGSTLVDVVSIPRGCTDWKGLFGSGTESRTVPAESMGSTGFDFAVPSDFPEGVYAFRVHNTALTARINPPIVNWSMGLGHVLRPDSACPGDSLNVVGLNFPGRGYVLLRGPGGQQHHLPYQTSDAFQLKVALPSGLVPGTYALQVAPGATADATASDPVTLTVQQDVPPRVVFVDCSALRGDGVTDNTEAMTKYLAGHVPERGTEVRFRLPPGTFLFKGPVTLLPHQYLVGAGEDKTTWKGAGPDGEAPDYWITGTHHFGLSDLSLVAPLRRALVSNFTELYHFSLNRTHEGFVSLDHVSITCSNTAPPPGEGPFPSVLLLGGPDLRITHVTIQDGQVDASGELVVSMYLLPLGGALLEHDSLLVTKGGLGMFLYSCRDVLFEDNSVSGYSATAGANAGTSLVTAKILGSARNILVAHNRYADFTEHDREGVTTDLGGGAYLGFADRSTPTRTTLRDEPAWGPDPVTPGRYRITITAGTGVGQSRHVQAGVGNVITVDRPWTVPPDEHSVVSISLYQDNIQVMDNTFDNTGYIQFYGGVFDGDIVGNQMNNAMGISLYSGIYFCASQPIQNSIVTDNSVLGSRGRDTVHNFGIFVCARNTTSINGVLMRDNRVSDRAAINFRSVTRRMRGVLLENNTGAVTFPPGAAAEPGAGNILIH